MKELYLIAAMDKNRLIGKGGKMPWHIPQDLKLFKEMTSGHIIVMGRKTYESIGKPLPNRVNIIISRKPLEIDGCIVFDSILKAIRYGEGQDKKLFFIGGADIYSQVANIISYMYISKIKDEYEGDTYFPDIDFDRFDVESREDYGDFELIKYSRNAR